MKSMMLAMALIVMSGASADDEVKLTRLFWQDLATQKMKWANVNAAVGVTSVQEIPEFVKLDPEKNNLVQMECLDQILVVGVRDHEDGKFQSGWVGIRTGVDKESHGDHFHWAYPGTPQVIISKLNKEQGNPAHVYRYGNAIYVANDRKNGCTRIVPEKITSADGSQFIPGGGNHITMAAVDGKVMYSGWPDGRVDVTSMAGSTPSIKYTFKLKHSGLHGAIENSGKVFFAPSDGVIWCDVDLDAKLNADQVKQHHISIGKVGEKPMRTGAFEQLDKFVLFTSGKGKDACVCLLDAAQDEPTLTKISVPMADVNAPASLAVVKTRKGRSLAFVCHDHKADEDGPNELTIIDIDVNKDGNASDSQIIKTIPIGKAKVDGHYGHHSIAIDADRRNVFIANPGDGTILPVSLLDLEPRELIKVGGEPCHLLAVGGRAGH